MNGDPLGRDHLRSPDPLFGNYNFKPNAEINIVL